MPEEFLGGKATIADSQEIFYLTNWKDNIKFFDEPNEIISPAEKLADLYCLIKEKNSNQFVVYKGESKTNFYKVTHKNLNKSIDWNSQLFFQLKNSFNQKNHETELTINNYNSIDDIEFQTEEIKELKLHNYLNQNLKVFFNY